MPPPSDEMTFVLVIAKYERDSTVSILVSILYLRAKHKTTKNESKTEQVSGHAYRLSAKRALHHGTMLLSVDMNLLSGVLNVNKAKLRSKGNVALKLYTLSLISA